MGGNRVCHLEVGDEFIHHELDPHQTADVEGIAPRDADPVGDELEYESEEELQREGLSELRLACPIEPRDAPRPSQERVEEGDQRNEREQHPGHIQGQPEPVSRSGRSRFDHVRMLSLHFNLDFPHRHRVTLFRAEDLRDNDRRGCGHDHGGQKVAGEVYLCGSGGNPCRGGVCGSEKRHVGGHDPPRDVRHAAREDREELGFGQRRKVRADHQGRLRLTHKRVGGNAE